MKIKEKLQIRHKIGWQILMMIGITIVLPSVLFFMVMVHQYSDHLLQQTTAERSGILQEINKLTNFLLKDYQELSMTLYYNNLSKDVLDAGCYDQPSEDLELVIKGMRNTIPYIDSIAVCFGENVYSDGRSYGNLPEYREKYEQRVMEAEGRCVWLPTECMVSGESTRTPKTFALARALNSREGPVGTLYMFCSSNFFANIMSNPLLSEGGSHYYILAPEGRIVSSDRYDYTGTDLPIGLSREDCVGEKGFLNIASADGTHQIATYAAIEGTDWTSVIVSDEAYIYSSLYALEEMSLWFVVLYVLALIFGYSMIYVLLLRPLSHLSNGMHHVAKGEFLEVAAPPIKNEVEQLTASYNHMVVHIRQLLGKIREEEEAKNRQRIKVLYMQIGPHFLYNTLNSIKWMAALNNQSGIKTMVDALMKLIAGVTYNKNDHVTIRQELELLEQYIYIQKIRFVNFSIRYEIPEELMELQIGRFMIQPFVENSILHGLRGLACEGLITIRARVEDALYVEVEDNGRGFDPQAQQPSENGHDHVGIENVKERIRLHYGEDYGVRVESTPDQGTRVTLKLPIIKEVTT